MRKTKFLHILIMLALIIFIFENPDWVIRFFDNAETHISKKIEELSPNGFLISNEELSSLEDSGITGSEYKFDKRFYPYFDMLSIEGQILYKQVYANIKEIKKSFVPTINIPYKEVQQVMEAVYNDHPELFWVNTIYTYKYIENDIVVQITLDYNETVQHLEEAKKQFEDVSNRIIQNAKLLKSDIEKEKYVHDEILKIAEYELDSEMNQSAYSALITGKTVCAGYARAFQYIMIELGIPTYYVSGYSLQNHAWNIIVLDNEYYNVDLTWDKSNDDYQFFNLTDGDIKTTHTRNNLSINLPKCNGKKYKYLPNKNTTTLPEVENKNDSNSNDLIENEQRIEVTREPKEESNANHYHHLNHNTEKTLIN